MNLKQIAVAGLACCAIAVSCQGNDKKISYEDAEKYVKEHCTLDKAPKPKSGKAEWNFNDTDASFSKDAYESNIKPYLKETKDYVVSGNADLNPDKLITDVSTHFLLKVLNENILKTSFKDYDFFQNNTGIKVSKTSDWEGIKGTEEYQFDDKGRNVSSYQCSSGEVTYSGIKYKMNATIKFTFAY